MVAVRRGFVKIRGSDRRRFSNELVVSRYPLVSLLCVWRVKV